jgi:hypothetical protein
MAGVRAFLTAALVFLTAVPAAGGSFSSYRKNVKSFLRQDLSRFFADYYALKGGRMRVEFLYSAVRFDGGRKKRERPKLSPLDSAIKEVLEN